MTKRKQGTTTSTFGTKGRINHDASKFYNARMYTELSAKEVGQDFVINELPAELENKILRSSAEKMDELPDNCLHLMVTSPPYNASKEYDEDLSLEEYLSLLKNVFAETYRVLVPGGRACINIANLGRKPYLPLTAFITQIMIDIGFLMRGEIIWDKASSATPSTAWGSWKSASNPTLRDIHEYILIFSKQGYKRHLTSKEKEFKKNTISRDAFLESTKTIWQMKAASAKRIGHPAPFPEELPARLIELYSFETDIVLDPFMGSGTTALAALKNKRKFVGYEIVADYITLAQQRVKRWMADGGR
ncbi:MAG: site-specific DNA-methyltransferase [Bacteroidota bacterium]